MAIDDSLFTRSHRAVWLTTSAGTIRATIDRTRFEEGYNAVEGFAHSVAVIRDSVVTGSDG